MKRREPYIIDPAAMDAIMAIEGQVLTPQDVALLDEIRELPAREQMKRIREYVKEKS